MNNNFAEIKQRVVTYLQSVPALQKLTKLHYRLGHHHIEGERERE
jgi:hypothetical protein